MMPNTEADVKSSVRHSCSNDAIKRHKVLVLLLIGLGILLSHLPFKISNLFNDTAYSSRQEKSLSKSSTSAPLRLLSCNSALNITIHPELASLCFQPVKINSASASLLASLPGVGPKLAQNIHQYIEENGPFEKIAEIEKVNGIGPKKSQKISRYIDI